MMSTPQTHSRRDNRPLLFPKLAEIIKEQEILASPTTQENNGTEPLVLSSFFDSQHLLRISQIYEEQFRNEEQKQQLYRFNIFVPHTYQNELHLQEQQDRSLPESHSTSLPVLQSTSIVTKDDFQLNMPPVEATSTRYTDFASTPRQLALKILNAPPSQLSLLPPALTCPDGFHLYLREKNDDQHKPICEGDGSSSPAIIACPEGFISSSEGGIAIKNLTGNSLPSSSSQIHIWGCVRYHSKPRLFCENPDALLDGDICETRALELAKATCPENYTLTSAAGSSTCQLRVEVPMLCREGTFIGNGLCRVIRVIDKQEDESCQPSTRRQLRHRDTTTQSQHQVQSLRDTRAQKKGGSSGSSSSAAVESAEEQVVNDIMNRFTTLEQEREQMKIEEQRKESAPERINLALGDASFASPAAFATVKSQPAPAPLNNPVSGERRRAGAAARQSIGHKSAHSKAGGKQNKGARGIGVERNKKKEGLLARIAAGRKNRNLQETKETARGNPNEAALQIPSDYTRRPAASAIQETARGHISPSLYPTLKTSSGRSANLRNNGQDMHQLNVNRPLSESATTSFDVDDFQDSHQQFEGVRSVVILPALLNRLREAKLQIFSSLSATRPSRRRTSPSVFEEFQSKSVDIHEKMDDLLSVAFVSLHEEDAPKSWHDVHQEGWENIQTSDHVRPDVEYDSIIEHLDASRDCKVQCPNGSIVDPVDNKRCISTYLQLANCVGWREGLIEEVKKDVEVVAGANRQHAERLAVGVDSEPVLSNDRSTAKQLSVFDSRTTVHSPALYRTSVSVSGTPPVNKRNESVEWETVSHWAVPIGAPKRITNTTAERITTNDSGSQTANVGVTCDTDDTVDVTWVCPNSDSVTALIPSTDSLESTIAATAMCVTPYRRPAIKECTTKGTILVEGRCVEKTHATFKCPNNSRLIENKRGEARTTMWCREDNNSKGTTFVH